MLIQDPERDVFEQSHDMRLPIYLHLLPYDIDQQYALVVALTNLFVVLLNNLVHATRFNLVHAFEQALRLFDHFVTLVNLIVIDAVNGLLQEYIVQQVFGILLLLIEVTFCVFLMYR